jgi:Rho termination factor, N-terminal domain
MPDPSIKNEKLYRDLRREGDSEKAARISNAVAADGARSVGRRGGASGAYETWTVADLRRRAKELGLTGYSGLNKEDLIHELRSH